MSSPENLDKALVITSPSFWLAVVAGITIIAVSVLWALFSSIPVKVTGKGAMGYKYDFEYVTSEVNAVVNEVYATVGSIVEEGDPLYSYDTHSLSEEKEKICDRVLTVEAVTVDSTDDLITEDTRELIELKKSAEAGTLKMSEKEKELELQKEHLSEAVEAEKSARTAYLNARNACTAFENNGNNVSEHYETVVEAWKKSESYKASMDASDSLRMDAESEYEYYSYYEDSGDPEEREQYQIAKAAYESAYSNYYKLKSDYETALYTYNSLLEKYFPEAQPGLSPETQEQVLSALNAYNSQLEALKTDCSEKESAYSTAKSYANSMKSGVMSLEIGYQVEDNGQNNSHLTYLRDFDILKKSILDGLNKKISEYDNLIQDNVVFATSTGLVSLCSVDVGYSVRQGEIVAGIVGELEGDILTNGIADLESGKNIKPGMEVRIYPSTVNKYEYGYILGKVTEVYTAVGLTELTRLFFDDENLAKGLAGSGTYIPFMIDVERDETTASGLKWSTDNCRDLGLPDDETIVEIEVIIDNKRPIDMVIPYLGEKLEGIANRNGSK